MTVIRWLKVNGRLVEERALGSAFLVSIDGRKFDGTYFEAIRHCGRLGR